MDIATTLLDKEITLPTVSTGAMDKEILIIFCSPRAERPVIAGEMGLFYSGNRFFVPVSILPREQYIQRSI